MVITPTNQRVLGAATNKHRQVDRRDRANFLAGRVCNLGLEREASLGLTRASDLFEFVKTLSGATCCLGCTQRLYFLFSRKNI